ncbi:MAG: hypothetical protein IKP81_06115 [Paludibacteraceae bacterium]|nr:hypothetical protein [Paludibacteraceae bacterium]
MEKGKKLCQELKNIRKQIADANEIDYAPNECQHKGDCRGTCEKCEQEVRYIEQQLSLRKAAGKAIKIAGLFTGMAALSACGAATTDLNIDSTPLTGDTICPVNQLEGDVYAPEPEYETEGGDSTQVGQKKAGEVQAIPPELPVEGEVD